MERITQRHTKVRGYRAHAIAYLPLVDTKLPAIHRRAAAGALLRDQRLEIAIGHRGELRARMVSGVVR